MSGMTSLLLQALDRAGQSADAQVFLLAQLEPELLEAALERRRGWQRITAGAEVLRVVQELDLLPTITALALSSDTRRWVHRFRQRELAELFSGSYADEMRHRLPVYQHRIGVDPEVLSFVPPPKPQRLGWMDGMAYRIELSNADDSFVYERNHSGEHKSDAWACIFGRALSHGMSHGRGHYVTLDVSGRASPETRDMLHTLYPGNGDIGDDGIREICQGLCDAGGNIRSLTFDGNPRVTALGAHYIARAITAKALAGLVGLHLLDMQGLGENGLEIITNAISQGGCPDLERLSLSCRGALLCNVGSFEAALLATPRLRGLVVDLNHIGARSARAIAVATPKLEALSVCHCNLDDGAIGTLCSVVKSSLTDLVMFDCRPRWADQLHRAFPNAPLPDVMSSDGSEEEAE